MRSAIACLAAALASCTAKANDGRIRASGTFEADKLRILAPGMGKIESFTAEEGSKVGKDEVVAIIDAEDLELKKREVEAGLEMARWKLALVEKGVRPEDMKQIRAVKKEVKLQKSLADKNLERIEKLFATGGVSKSSLDEAVTQRDVVDSKLVQISAELQKARTGAQDEEKEVARAAVDQLEAGLAQIEKLIADRTITSPVAGTVLTTHAHEGEYVFPGQLLATVADLGDLDLVVYVTEKDVARVEVGGAASVHVDAFPDRWFAGKVVRIADEAEFTPSTVQTEDERAKLVFEVVIKVPNAEGWFKPGLPADAVIGK